MDRTVNSIQAELIHQRSGTCYKDFYRGRVSGYVGKILTAFAASTHRENDSQFGILLSQLSERSQTAFRTIHGHLGIGPFVTELSNPSVDSAGSDRQEKGEQHRLRHSL